MRCEAGWGWAKNIRISQSEAKKKVGSLTCSDQISCTSLG